MCCSLGPARLSRTILYGAEVILEDGGGLVHVVGYQNKAQSLIPSSSGHSGNAMILPFPAVHGSMTKANVIETEDCPNILEDLARAVTPPTRGGAYGSLGLVGSRAARVEVFNTGIYTVVLATDASLIPEALDQVPDEKRPPFNEAIFDAYADWYPGWSVALCCFNNREAKDSTPMLWWYDPRNTEELFLPALDCHTGDVPTLGAKVTLDHTIVVGSHQMAGMAIMPVNYSDVLPLHVRPYLLNRVVGTQLPPMQVPNGDFFVDVSDLRNGKFDMDRRDPLGN